MSGPVVFGMDIVAHPEHDHTGTVVVMQQIDGVMTVLSTHHESRPTYDETLTWCTDLMAKYDLPKGPPDADR